MHLGSHTPTHPPNIPLGCFSGQLDLDSAPICSSDSLRLVLLGANLAADNFLRITAKRFAYLAPLVVEAGWTRR